MATTSKTTKKTNKKSSGKIPHLYKEHDSEYHKISGKFVGLYILFAITTIIFAALSVYLFFFASKILTKYERIDAACREGNCQVIFNHDGSEIIDENVKD